MIELRKHATECRPFSVSGKATSASRARSRVATGLGVVEETKKKLGSGRLTPIYGVNSLFRIFAMGYSSSAEIAP